MELRKFVSQMVNRPLRDRRASHGLTLGPDLVQRCGQPIVPAPHVTRSGSAGALLLVPYFTASVPPDELRGPERLRRRL